MRHSEWKLAPNCTAPSRWIGDWYGTYFCGYASSFPLTGANETIMLPPKWNNLFYRIESKFATRVVLRLVRTTREKNEGRWDCINKPIQSAVFFSKLWNDFPPFNSKRLPSLGNWNVNWIMSKIHLNKLQNTNRLESFGMKVWNSKHTQASLSSLLQSIKYNVASN